jgi:hypothetical protein
MAWHIRIIGSSSIAFRLSSKDLISLCNLELDLELDFLLFNSALVAAGLLGTISGYLVQPAHAQGGTCATGGVGSGGSASTAFGNAATGDTGCGSGAGVTSGTCAASSFNEILACIGQ